MVGDAGDGTAGIELCAWAFVALVIWVLQLLVKLVEAFSAFCSAVLSPLERLDTAVESAGQGVRTAVPLPAVPLSHSLRT